MTVSDEMVERFRQRLIDTKCTSHDGSVVVESTERVLSCLTAALSDQVVVPGGYLIWWTNENDCERIVPLDTWPMYLYNEYQSRQGRNGRGRLWCSAKIKDAPKAVTIDWDTLTNWLCKAAEDAGGIVIKAEHAPQVQYLPGFLTTFEMTLPTPPASTSGEVE